MKLATLALALGLASPAFAASPFLVDFEKTWDYGQAVDNIYAAQGVSFVNVLGLSNGDGLGGLAGFLGSFSRNFWWHVDGESGSVRLMLGCRVTCLLFMSQNSGERVCWRQIFISTCWREKIF